MSPGRSVPESHRPSSEVVVWPTDPKFFHPTSVPLGTEMVAGMKAKSTILIFAMACGDRASWEIAAVGPTIMSPHATAHASSARAFVIENLLRRAGRADTTRQPRLGVARPEDRNPRTGV